MERINVSSSQLKSIGYDPSTKILEIEFLPNRADSTGTSVYQYADVPPSVWEAFYRAPSPGSFFYKNIKGVYAYKKVE